MRERIKWWQISLMLAVVVLFALGLSMLWERVRTQQVAAKRMTCQGHLSMISLGLREYHRENGHFPPAYVLGTDGRPWHSWRILLLPYIGEYELYKDYNFDEPWDGPNNRNLQTRMPKYYACPSDPENLERGRTNYFAVVGRDTAFPGAKPTKIDDVSRPRDQSILVVEAIGQDINWMEPRDLSFDNMSFEINDPNLPSISSKHQAHNVVMVDGTIQHVHGITPFDLRTMFLIREQPEQRKKNKD